MHRLDPFLRIPRDLLFLIWDHDEPCVWFSTYSQICSAWRTALGCCSKMNAVLPRHLATFNYPFPWISITAYYSDARFIYCCNLIECRVFRVDKRNEIPTTHNRIPYAPSGMAFDSQDNCLYLANSNNICTLRIEDWHRETHYQYEHLLYLSHAVISLTITKTFVWVLTKSSDIVRIRKKDVQEKKIFHCVIDTNNTETAVAHHRFAVQEVDDNEFNAFGICYDTRCWAFAPKSMHATFLFDMNPSALDSDVVICEKNVLFTCSVRNRILLYNTCGTVIYRVPLPWKTVDQFPCTSFLWREDLGQLASYLYLRNNKVSEYLVHCSSRV